MRYNPFLFFTCLFFACSGNDDNTPTPDKLEAYSYQQPEEVNDGWQTAHLSEVGITTRMIEDMVNNEDLKHINFHSALIVSNNQLVFEHYWPGKTAHGQIINFDKYTLHELHSVSKSVTSLLVGLGISQDFISSVDDPIKDYLPEYATVFESPDKNNILIRHILMMQAGIEWDEWTLPYSDSRNSHVAMNSSDDPVYYVLSQQMAEQPGAAFVYNSGLTITAGKILENATGQDLGQYAKEHLFSPLGIDRFSWYKYPNGIYQAGGGLALTPRDMAKLGQLVLNNGFWDDIALVDESWIVESVEAKIDFPENWYEDHYGYFWWQQDFEVNGQIIKSIHASGYGGQHIYIVPAYDLVVVFTAGNYDSVELSNKPIQLMKKYILPELN